MSTNKELIVFNSFFSKIKQSFKNIFKKNIVENNDTIISENYRNSNDDFENRITIKQDEEEIRILELQRRFSNKEITEDEISKEDVIKISELYDKQIADIKEKINQNISLTEKYKQEILKAKKKAI